MCLQNIFKSSKHQSILLYAIIKSDNARNCTCIFQIIKNVWYFMEYMAKYKDM